MTRRTLFILCVLALAFSLTASTARRIIHPVPTGTITAQGYGGDIPLLIKSDDARRITAISALTNNETPSYVGDLNDFLRQFIGKGPQDPLAVDGITRATITSTGITRAVQKHFNPSLTSPDNKVILIPALIALSLLALAIAALLLKNTLLHWAAMIGSFIFFGVMHKSMLSIIQVINAAMLNIPPLDVNILWAVTLAIGFIPALIIGRIHCASLCPFALIQEISARILPKKFQPAKISCATETQAKLIKYILAIELILMCVLANTSAPANIEPFATLFSTHASWLAWAFLGLMIILGVLYSRFWCVYLCPVGAMTGLVSQFSIFKIQTRTPCVTCSACVQICPVNAITLKDEKTINVDAAECLLCGECLTACPNKTLAMRKAQ